MVCLQQCTVQQQCAFNVGRALLGFEGRKVRDWLIDLIESSPGE